MKIKALIIVLLSFIIASCSEKHSYAVLSDEEAAVYFSYGDTFLQVDVSESTLGYLSQASGMSKEDVINDIFSIDAVMLDNDDYAKRKGLLELLRHESSESSVLSAIKKYSKDLRKTEFMNTINELSYPFDNLNMVKDISKARQVIELSLSYVEESSTTDYDRIKEHIRIWIDQVMR